MPLFVVISWLCAACVPVAVEMHAIIEEDGAGELIIGVGLPLSEAEDVDCSEADTAEMPPGSTIETEIRGSELWCVVQVPVSSLSELESLLALENDDGTQTFDVMCLAQENDRLYLAVAHPLNEGDEPADGEEQPTFSFMVTTGEAVESHNAAAQIDDTLVWNVSTPPQLFLVNLSEGDVCPTNGRTIELPDSVESTASAEGDSGDEATEEADQTQNADDASSAATSDSDAAATSEQQETDAPESAAASVCGPGAEMEENNSFGSANPLLIGCPLRSTLLPAGDRDWFTFDVAQHGELQLSVANVAPDIAVNVRLWNANKDAVTGWYAPLAVGGNTDATIDLPAPGRYVFEIVGGDSRQLSDQPFELATTFTPSVDQGEPNGSFGRSSLLALGAEQQITLLPAGDRDWLHFEVDHHGELRLSFSNVASDLAVDVRVWTADKDTLTSWFSPLAVGGDTLAVVDLPAAGRYVLEVVADNSSQRSIEPVTVRADFTPSADEAEPNGSFGTAKRLFSGRAVEATLLPAGDRDWYVIGVDHHGELRLAITNVATELAVNVRVWNANKDTLTGWFAPLAAGGDTLAVVDLPEPGDYYLEIVGNDNKQRNIEPFILQATFTPAPDNNEINNSFGQAAPLSLDASIPVNILPAGDRDWFYVDVTHQGELQLLASEVPPDLAISLRAWNANKDTMTGWFAPLSSGGDTAALVDLPSPGRYYFEIAAGDSSQRNINSFLLSTRFRGAADMGEPNNTLETATPVDLDETIPANILPAGDQDWCQLQIEETGELRIAVVNAAPELTIQFRLRDSNNSVMSDWFRPLSQGGNIEASVPIAEPGMYFLEISDNSSSARSIQPYLLRFSMEPIDLADVVLADDEAPPATVEVEPQEAETIELDGETSQIVSFATESGERIELLIPADALPSGETVELAVGLIANFDEIIADSTVTTELGAASLDGELIPVGPVIHLAPAGQVFDNPLQLTLPVDPGGLAPAATGYWVLLGAEQEDGSWTWEAFSAEDVNVDPDASTVTVQIGHFSGAAPVGVTANTTQTSSESATARTATSEEITQLKNMVSHFIGQFQQENDCFAPAVSLGDPLLYRSVLDRVQVIIDPDAGDVQGKMSADGKVLTLIAAPGDVSRSQLHNYETTLWHELTHSIEIIDHWDNWNRYSSLSKFSDSYEPILEDYNERNTQYMETAVAQLQQIRRLEAMVGETGVTDDQLRRKWTLIRQQLASGSTNASFPVPELAKLNSWTNFSVDLDAIEELYRSGQCGSALARIFNDEPSEDDSGSTVPAPSDQEAYAVYLAANNEILVGQRTQLEGLATCGLTGWGINCEQTVAQVTSLTQVLGPFDSMEEARAAFCNDLVAGSVRYPPLVVGFVGTMSFDGEEHWISNAPRCP